MASNQKVEENRHYNFTSWEVLFLQPVYSIQYTIQYTPCHVYYASKWHGLATVPNQMLLRVLFVPLMSTTLYHYIIYKP